MTISMPARPPAPFKPLRMNVNRHYYIKTKKQEKINSHPPQKKKCVTSKNKQLRQKNKKQFTHQSDSESHCGLLTRKKRKKRNNDQ